MASHEAAIPLPTDPNELRTFCAALNKNFCEQAVKSDPKYRELLPSEAIKDLVKAVDGALAMLKEDGLFKEVQK